MSKKKSKVKPARPIGGWTIAWNGHQWSDSDLTVEHLAALAIISRDDSFGSLELNPKVISDYPGEGYMRLVFMVSALAGVAACEGVDGEEAKFRMAAELARVKAAKAEDVLAAITFHRLRQVS